ncbi:MAG: hypothetical protein IPG01_04675 [Chitinophagaceae bacterium]|nr:hypothetical protein [Chitinophagaceae bacterium]
MKASTIHELKAELEHFSQPDLMALCLRMARFKKENKELLTYLIFMGHDEQAFVESIKAEMDAQFIEIPTDHNLYFVKKSVRKILRITNKFIRYSGDRTTAVTLLLYFCSKLKESGIRMEESAALTNLYALQQSKIEKMLPLLHEDLQYDFRKEMDRLGS